MFRKNTHIIAIGAFLALLTMVHVFILQKLSPRVVLEELYYIPILFAAFRFGLKGSIITYLLASLLYLPFFFGLWSSTYLDLLDRALHLLFSALFAFLAGLFVERVKRQQKELERNRYLANLGHVAATIVHDLKNPLITILGFARRIREGKGNIDTAAEAITESVQNMQKIVHNVLDFSKPVQLELKEGDLRNVIRQASESCMAKAEEKGVNLSADIPELPVTVATDSFNMQRALINLINNAIEASGKGQRVRIAIVARKSRVAITIKDYGSGMDSETVENIFFPFYSKKSSGTGLGMAIAKKIIDGHQGRIIIKSQTGKGTEVEIELPYNPATG
ncbi:MAG: HAMP domain-containing histidine kinase [Nitrospirae bacterium]|nr:HAMP domain-containing histidine kinase [Nitrospirota bacterium]